MVKIQYILSRGYNSWMVGIVAIVGWLTMELCNNTTIQLNLLPDSGEKLASVRVNEHVIGAQ